MRSVSALGAVLASASPRPVAVTRQPTLEALGWQGIADELRDELRAALAAAGPRGRPGLAFVVREDGVEIIERGELVRHYRSNGLSDLAGRVRRAPIDRALIVLEGDEVAVLHFDAAGWLASTEER